MPYSTLQVSRMDIPIPPHTLLTVTAVCDGKETDFVCTVLGYGRFGIQLSLPQLLNKVYALPGTTSIRCSFISVSTNQFLAFNSYVMGYERTEPPCMIIALPDSLENTTRRAALRFPARVPVSYVAECDDDIYGEETQSLDLSLDGLKMVTGRLHKKGAVMSLTVDLQGEVITITGAVSWSAFKGRKAATGVRFLRMPSRARVALARYLGDLERQVRPTVAKPEG